MQKTIFHVKEMDCPSEESLIRMKLDGIPEIVRMDIDIQNRTATIYHKNRTIEIENALNELKLGSSLVSSEHIEEEVSADTENKKQNYFKYVFCFNNAFQSI